MSSSPEPNTDTDIYTSLTSILSTRHNTHQILDFQILPPGFGHFLRHDPAIGISKTALVQAFVVARRQFFSLSSQHPYPTTPHPSPDEPTLDTRAAAASIYDNPQTLRATEVILLLDSEHLTACNWRKRRICALKQQQQQHYLDALHADLSFTTSLLRSPLHRHSKSPTLWHHRKWIISQLLAVDISPAEAFRGSHHLAEPSGDVEGKAEHDDPIQRIVAYEVSVVLEAGAHHPNNYYAFSYLREVMGLFAKPVSTATTTAMTQGAADSGNVLLARLARGVIGTVHAWCFSHGRDISGWSFLLFLLEMLGDDDALRKQVIAKTARFGRNVLWDREGLWMFVDLAMARFGLVEGEVEGFEELERFAYRYHLDEHVGTTTTTTEDDQKVAAVEHVDDRGGGGDGGEKRWKRWTAYMAALHSGKVIRMTTAQPAGK
ncbi:hypothetical protein FQN52_004201 [Onygenales sp. PD_12]|nr:hypothetical protein FQN52_004201 [Onygenales sp. PD_12]